MMNKDLFGMAVPLNIEAAEEELKSYDTNSFKERLVRLKYVNQIFPFGRREYGSDESFRIFNEAIQTYIFGQYVATIILSQAFIERRMQEYFHMRMDQKRSKFTLNKLLQEFKTTGFIDDYFIERIDRIRLKRNPFVHHKEPLNENSLLKRSFESNITPDELIEKDAKESLSLMLTISRFRLL